tara:strand:- start:248 stop:421 length:174 start_codon:yes stop_codon:yes gene_type:complete
MTDEIIMGFASGETYVLDGQLALVTKDVEGISLTWDVVKDKIEYVVVKNKLSMEVQI